MEISTELRDAKAAVDEAVAKRKALADLVASDSAKMAAAEQRIAAIDSEIVEVNEEMVEASVQVLVATGSAPADPAARQAQDKHADRLKALNRERAALTGEFEQLRARAAALARQTAVAGEAALAARRDFVAAWPPFERNMAAELERDLAELPLPQVFAKWYGLNFFTQALDALGLGLYGETVFSAGRWRHPTQGWIDYREMRPGDSALMALRDELAALRIVERRSRELIAEAEHQARDAAERTRAAEQRRRQAAAAMAGTHIPRNRPMPVPDAPIFDHGRPATPRATYHVRVGGQAR